MEPEVSLFDEVNRLHAQFRRQAEQSQPPPLDVPTAANRLIETAPSVSESKRNQAPTAAADRETTNRELAVVAYATSTQIIAASVAERTA